MKLSIVYFNDVHGYLEEHPELFYEGAKEVIRTAGGYSRISSFIQSVKKNNPDTLVFDGGDTFHGTYPLVQSKGEIIVPILNNLGISAMVGHWDFGYGAQQLLHLAGKLNYPVLGINVYKEDGDLLLPAYHIKKVADVTIGIIGICSNISDKIIPEQFREGLTVTSGYEVLPGYIKQVREKGADIVILLSHNGFPQDCEMIAKIEGIDICLSAHTHNRLYEALTINNTILIQCGCHGSFAGNLELQINNKKIEDFSYRLVPMDDAIEKDNVLEAMVQQALQEFKHNEEKVGKTPLMLHRYDVMNGTMDNFLLAAIAHATNCRIAFSNGWRYGAPIPKGEISKNDLYNIIPMNPPVSTVELSGDEIKNMLEENIERTFSCNPMNQMGGYLKRCLGLSAYIKIENPKGQRIQELFIEGNPYEKTKRYKTAFVTKQGVPEKYGINRTNLSLKAVDAMTDYLKTDLFTEKIIKEVTFKTI